MFQACSEYKDSLLDDSQVSESKQIQTTVLPEL